MNREEYINKIYNEVSIKVCGAVESNPDNMWQLIIDYIKAGIEETYDNAFNEGYNEGYGEGYDDCTIDSQYDDEL